MVSVNSQTLIPGTIKEEEAEEGEEETAKLGGAISHQIAEPRASGEKRFEEK